MKKSLNLYQQIAYNKRTSLLIIAGFALLGLVFALALTAFMEWSPETGIFVLIVIGMLMLVQYWFSSKMILGISGARPAQREEYPFIYHTVEGLAIAAGIPAPECYIIDSPAPNAFATGLTPQEGVIAITTGLIDKLNNEELEGVIAHEMAHIQNYDIRLTTIAIAFIGAISLISEVISRNLWFVGGSRRDRSKKEHRGGGLFALVGLVFIIFAPLFARMLHLTLSRKREFYADSAGAWLTRNPAGLAAALRKIAGDKAPLRQANATIAPLYIVNPFNKAARMHNWFSTHPPLEERIEILERLAYKF